MARPLRIELADGVFHVTSRGLDRQPIVCDDRDRQKWTALLGAVVTRRRWIVLAWSLMDNHFHLFLRTPLANLSQGMHDLNSGYATWFNRRHQRRGPLLQGRFKAILVERNHHYWELSRYIHLNPVRAGLVQRPEQHRWGSCALYVRGRAAPSWLALSEVLCLHGQTLRAARRRYAEFLAEGIAHPPESPLSEAFASSLLGSASFVEKLRALLFDWKEDRELPALRRLRPAVQIAEVERAVSRTFQGTPDSLHVRGRWHNEARSAAIYLCRTLTQTPLKELGAQFGGICTSAVSRIAASVEQERRRNNVLHQRLRECEEALSKSK